MPGQPAYNEVLVIDARDSNSKQSMDESKIQQLLALSLEYTTLLRIIHAGNLEYDEEGAEEYKRQAAEIHARGRELRNSMSAEEIQEFERRLSDS